MAISLDARFIMLQMKTTGMDSLVDSLLSGKEEHRDLVKLLNKSKIIKHSALKRGYVEACLLASRDLEKISDLIEVPVPVLTMYRDIFFNVKDFDRLSLMEVVDVSPDEEKPMKLWALSQGLDFISWRLGKVLNINPVDGLQELFTLSVFKSKEALFSGNASESSMEAAKWAKLSMELAKILKSWVMDSHAAKRDIEMALQEIIPEFQGFDSLV